MRILILHTYYQKRGGEDSVFENEVKLLSAEYNVHTLSFNNYSGILGAIQFIFSFFNVISIIRIHRCIKDFIPNVIHIHNFHFALGPAVFCLAKFHSIPIVLTLHNYRLLCPSGSLFYKNNLFLDSLSCSFPAKAVRYKVYRDSFFQTFWLSFTIWIYKKLGIFKYISRFIVLSNFQRDVFINTSSSLFTLQSVIVKPNFTFIKSDVYDFDRKSDSFLFVGRLEANKGLLVLIEAFKKLDYKLIIIGNGSLLSHVIEASNHHSNITYVEFCNSDTVHHYMLQSSCLIMPSIWYEPFGLVTIEAFSAGTPVIASNIASMSEMIINNFNGFHFEVNNVDDLIIVVKKWFDMPNELKKQFYTNALATYNKYYTPSRNLQLLSDIYSAVL